MPGRVSQARREREALANSSRRDDSDQEEDGEVDDLPESRRRKRRKRLSEMNADDLFEEMDPKEKAQVSADYRKMQAEVDGTCSCVQWCLGQRKDGVDGWADE